MSELAREITLEKTKVALQRRVSDHLLMTSELEFDLLMDHVADCLITDVKMFLLGEDGKTVTVKYPETWWEAIKERFFHKKLLARFPVKYKVHTITGKVLYPELGVKLPKEKHFMTFQEYTTDETVHRPLQSDIEIREPEI